MQIDEKTMERINEHLWRFTQDDSHIPCIKYKACK